MEPVAEVGGGAPTAGSPGGRPLRVLHIASGDLWAGAEAQIYTLLRGLMSRVPQIQCAAALMNDGELAARLRQSGLSVHIFDEKRIGSIGILRGLRQLMGSWRPDIVHTHRTKENILGSLANRSAGSVPSIRTVHGASERASGGLRGLRESLVSGIDLWCARNWQSRVIAVSAELGRKLAATLPARKIVVIENGVDVEDICSSVHAVTFRTAMPDHVHVGIAGRLVPVKRIDLFISMAVILKQQHPEIPWHFHVFGDGPLRDSLERLAECESLSITFHGHRQDIIACLAALDVLVMCSDHEGMPMTALESLAVGTRIAAHAVGGLKDALAGCEQAVLVQDHGPAAYAAAVWQLMSPDARARPAGSVPERLRASSTVARTYALYLDLLGSRAPDVAT